MKKGPCFKKTCHRRASANGVVSCRICDLAISCCGFHREVAYSEIQQHCLVDHPAEVRAAREAFGADAPPAHVAIDGGIAIDKPAAT